MHDKKCQCSIKIENLAVQRGADTILHDVNLHVNHGEILALIGKNGSGKSTLLKSIMGSIKYTGTISFYNSKGQKISKPKIGYVPQTLLFDKNAPISVLDMFCANSSNLPVFFGYTKSRKKHVKDLLCKFGAGDHIDKKLGMLSGGELQRVLLAFALDPMPDILLLDEPVSAIDRKGISDFYELISYMRNEYHMPIVIVSHDLGHVQKYATYAALIDKTVIAYEKAEHILQNKIARETFGFDVTGGGI